MNRNALATWIICLACLAVGCKSNSVEHKTDMNKSKSAKEILSDPAYRAISYGGYRAISRDQQPTISQLKEDMLLLSAIGIKMIRTYNVTKPHAANVLAAIAEIKKENPDYEMYVMLGAWIDCAGAWTEHPNHNDEHKEHNEAEIARAVDLANKYPDIVKVIAVGNEAMVKWAASYYVQPWVILKYVTHLQKLKQTAGLPADLWVTSSDNFASWGGGDSEYHVEDLEKLVQSVDFVSMHTYPMHDTHYNPNFWGVSEDESKATKVAQIDAAMQRALEYAQNQYESTKKYVRSLGVNVPIHIGETGWASASNGFYGGNGSQACDEYKEAVYHKKMREWTDREKIACFYFEAFDEIWKDAANQGGSENHFGLFTIDGKAKYAIWDAVDQGKFDGLGRNAQPVTKTFNGDKEALLNAATMPPVKQSLQVVE